MTTPETEGRIMALEKRHDRLKVRTARLQDELIDVHKELTELKLSVTHHVETVILPGMV